MQIHGYIRNDNPAIGGYTIDHALDNPIAQSFKFACYRIYGPDKTLKTQADAVAEVVAALRNLKVKEITCFSKVVPAA